jgi:hypothetical protein
MLAKVLLWWPAAATISGIIIVAVATLSLSLGILVLILCTVFWLPIFRALWSWIQPTASWTYFNKSDVDPAEQSIYIWPEIKGIAISASVYDADKRPIDLAITDNDIEAALAAGHSVATGWRASILQVAAKNRVPVIPVFVKGDEAPTWDKSLEYMRGPTPKCRITYAPALRLTVRESVRGEEIWTSHLDLSRALCDETRRAKKSGKQ